jgi:hypothetical protein
VTRGTHSPSFVDRTGITYGSLTAVACLGRDHTRRAVWSCRCGCGRPDCAGLVERSSAHLARGDRPDCRRRVRAPRLAAPPPVPATVAPPVPEPEGVRPPWSRSADERAARDARLLAAFAGGDLR